MKRSEMPRSQKPLPRRTPMPQQQAPLQRSGRLRFRSPRMEQVYRKVRRPLVQMLLASNPLCERCLKRPATQVHEIKTRARGGSITNEANCAVLCGQCHSEVTTPPPGDPTAGGWLLNSWDPEPEA